jgi:hypothetical protein
VIRNKEFERLTNCEFCDKKEGTLTTRCSFVSLVQLI